jgi:3-oxoacyl-[acyl-carrier protein] reductase
MAGADILVNSAGFTRFIPHADLDALDDETFDRILRVNTRAAFSAIRAFAPQLCARGGGLIVQISSIAATTAFGSNIAYCAAKAGMDAVGMVLAKALLLRSASSRCLREWSTPTSFLDATAPHARRRPQPR